MVVVVGLVLQAYSVIEQQRQAKAAARSQKEASDIASAAAQNSEADKRRQIARQQRIRTAQIEQAASNTGTSQSSGELGSLASLSTNAGAALASMSGQTAAANGIGAANQNTLNAQSKAQTASSVGQVASSVTSMAQGAYFSNFSNAFGSLFSSATQSNKADQVAYDINK